MKRAEFVANERDVHPFFSDVEELHVKDRHPERERERRLIAIIFFLVVLLLFMGWMYWRALIAF